MAKFIFPFFVFCHWLDLNRESLGQILYIIELFKLV